MGDWQRRDAALFLGELSPEALARINAVLDRLDAVKDAAKARRARVKWDAKRRMPVIRPAKE